MAKTNAMICVDPEVLKTFDAIVGARKRGPKIQELMEAFIETHMDSRVKPAEPGVIEEQLKLEE